MYLVVVLPPGRCHWSFDGELVPVRLVSELHLDMTPDAPDNSSWQQHDGLAKSGHAA